MSNGKYSMKINAPANQQLPWSTNDPWYNLGGLIGAAWGDNYNRRGEAKAIDEMQRVYNNMQNQPNSVSNQPLPQNLSVSDNIMGQNLQVPDNIAKQYDMARAIGTANVVSDNKTPSTASTTTSSGATAQAPQRDVAAEKLDAVANKYINAGTDNPDGDKRIIGTMTDAVRNGLATYDLSKLPMTDMNQMRALLVAEARKHGRTDYQIQRALEAVMPDLQSKVNEAKNNKWGQLRSILDQQIQSGQLDNAMVTYAEMGKLLPEKTAALKNKVDRMWEPFNIDRKFDLQKDYYKRKFGLSDREAQNMIETGNTLYSKREADALGLATKNGVFGSYGGKGSSKGSSRSGGSGYSNGGTINGGFYGFDMSNASVKYVNEQIKTLEERKAAGEGWSDADEQRLQNLYNWKEDAETASGIIPTSPDWIARKMDSFINGGGSDEDIENTAAQMFGRGSWQYKVAMQRLQERRNAQHDNGYDADTFRDDNVEKEIAKEKSAPPPPEQPNAKGHTGLAAYLDEATDNLLKAWDDFKFSKMADYGRKR